MPDPLNSDRSLCRLSDAEYEVAPDQPDVRGWKVLLGNEHVIGEVNDLIIDWAGKVRYLDVDLDKQVLGFDRHRHVLIPGADAHLDREEEEVVLKGITRAALLSLPEYTGTSIADGYDKMYRSQLSGDTASKRITRTAEELKIRKRIRADVRD